MLKWLRDVALPLLFDLIQLLDVVGDMVLPPVAVRVGLILLEFRLGYLLFLNQELRMRDILELFPQNKCMNRLLRMPHR